MSEQPDEHAAAPAAEDSAEAAKPKKAKAEKKPRHKQAAEAAERVLGENAGRVSRVAEKASRVAKDVIEAASETARGAIDVAGDAARNVVQATSVGAQTVAKLAEDGARVAVQLAGEGARAAGQLAQEVALQMAQTYLRKSPLTLDIPESRVTKHLRERAVGHEFIDYVTVYCGDDRLKVAVDGHYRRFVYTLDLSFDVLECKISRGARFMRVRQISEDLDAQLRQGNLLTNFATRRIASSAFAAANRLPTYAPIKQFLEDMPGVSREGPRLWHIDLDKTDLMQLLNDRAWMIEKLLNLGERIDLPGLSTLRESREMLQKLVSQFEIRDLRVRPGRLEMLVGISS